MKVVVLPTYAMMLIWFSKCEEGCRLYQALVCMGERIIRRNDFGLDCKEARFDLREGI